MITLLIHSIEVFFSVLNFFFFAFSSALHCSSFRLFVLNGCNETNMNLSRERHRVSLFFVSSLLPIHCFVASVLKVPLTQLPLLLASSATIHYFWIHWIQNSKIRAFIFIKWLYTWVYGHLGCCLFLVRLFSIFLFRSFWLNLVKWLSQELHTNAYLKVLNYMRYAT